MQRYTRCHRADWHPIHEYEQKLEFLLSQQKPLDNQANVQKNIF